jgi:hypothetical protein
VRTAKDPRVLLDSMANDPLATVTASRSEHFDRALERVERMRPTVHRDLKCLVVIVTAGFASCEHGIRCTCGASVVPYSRVDRHERMVVGGKPDRALQKLQESPP